MTMLVNTINNAKYARTNDSVKELIQGNKNQDFFSTSEEKKEEEMIKAIEQWDLFQKYKAKFQREEILREKMVQKVIPKYHQFVKFGESPGESKE